MELLLLLLLLFCVFCDDFDGVVDVVVVPPTIGDCVAGGFPMCGPLLINQFAK